MAEGNLHTRQELEIVLETIVDLETSGKEAHSPRSYYRLSTGFTSMLLRSSRVGEGETKA